MIIVNQLKEKIVIFRNISSIDVNYWSCEDKYLIECTVIDGTDYILGRYKTKERAKEVLAEIAERYSNWENLLAGQPQGICSPKYEMPLE